MIKVLVNGALGKMGSEVVKAVSKEKDLQLVGQIDIKDDLKASILSLKPDVVVDFTHPKVAMDNVRKILNAKANAVVGTTGFIEENLKEIEQLCKNNSVSCLVAPNFTIGGVLMMKFAKEAIKHLPSAEIIELHHDQKADSPSGTAVKTAEMMIESAGSKLVPGKTSEVEKLEGARGADMEGIRIHAVRLPGYVASQEVIFGGPGQTLTIRHDTISRECFMPGVLIGIRKIISAKGLVYGLEHLL
jgi:4-hydroxy-tetrahydrodipicolinate reductase